MRTIYRIYNAKTELPSVTVTTDVEVPDQADPEASTGESIKSASEVAAMLNAAFDFVRATSKCQFLASGDLRVQEFDSTKEDMSKAWKD